MHRRAAGRGGDRSGRRRGRLRRGAAQTQDNQQRRRGAHHHARRSASAGQAAERRDGSATAGGGGSRRPLVPGCAMARCGRAGWSEGARREEERRKHAVAARRLRPTACAHHQDCAALRHCESSGAERRECTTLSQCGTTTFSSFCHAPVPRTPHDGGRLVERRVAGRVRRGVGRRPCGQPLARAGVQARADGAGHRRRGAGCAAALRGRAGARRGRSSRASCSRGFRRAARALPAPPGLRPRPVHPLLRAEGRRGGRGRRGGAPPALVRTRRLAPTTAPPR